MDPAPALRTPRRVRAIWVSDVHLGTKGAQAAALLEFLQAHNPEFLYLVGDIVDGWALRKSWFWDEAHNAVLRRVLQLAAEGAQVRLICGNHDEFLRSWIGLDLGGIRIVEETEHRTADGRRLLVHHGDRFDAVVRSAPWLAHLGSGAYRLMLVVNAGFNWLRRRFGYPYWSLSLFLKQKVKSALAYRESFEHAAARDAHARGFQGVVCGHIHKPEIREVEGVAYLNSGDWVESCTALVEDAEGRIALLEWKAEGAAAGPRGGRRR